MSGRVGTGTGTALLGGDLQIGAVEIKDATTDTRATVGSDGLHVDVQSMTPGTDATDLGKAIGTAVGATDTGVLALAVHDAEATKIAVSEEQFDHLHIGELGGLSVEPEQHNHLDELDATTGWAVLNDDTDNLATTDNHLTGSKALTFDKIGTGNSVLAGIDKTITTLDMGELDLHDILQVACFTSSITNIDYIFVRIGTSSSNYNEWRVDADQITENEWSILGLPLGGAKKAGNTGTGVDWGAIAYVALGVAFDATGNTLSGILFDQIGIFTGSHSTTSLTAEVTSTVTSPNVTIKKWGSKNVTNAFTVADNTSTPGIMPGIASFGMYYDGANWDLARGTSADGLLVNLGANNDISGTVTANLGVTDNAVLDAIAASLAIMDDWDDTNYANVNVNMAGTDAATNSGVLNAQTQRVTIATDDEVNNLLGTIDTDTSSMSADLGTIDTDTGAMVTDLAAIEVLLTGIDSDTNTIQGAVAGGQMQVDIVADGAGLATTSKQDDIIADTNAIQIAVQLIDDAIFVDDTATHSTGTTKGMGIMAVAQPTDTSIGINDIGMIAMSTDRRVLTDTQIVGQDSNLTVDLGSTDNTVLDAIAASLSVLDDWDDSNYANMNMNMAGTDVAANSGTLNAQTQRVTIATDDEVNNLLGTIDTDTSSMATDLGTIDTDTGAMVTDLAAIEVLLTNIDSDTNTIQGDTTSIQAAVEIMDDWDNIASDGASVSGDTAHDGVDAGEPVKLGAKAYSPDGTTPGTAVAENDRSNLKSDLDGRMFVNTASPQKAHKHLDGSSALTDTALTADPGDGFQVVITSIIVSTGAGTAMNFFIEEGSTKIFGPIYLEATAGRGFVSGPINLPVTASTASTITTSAAIAQSTDVDYYIEAV